MRKHIIKEIVESIHEKVDVATVKVESHLPEETTITDVEEDVDCITDTVGEVIE